jgi:hypothetical protein
MAPLRSKDIAHEFPPPATLSDECPMERAQTRSKALIALTIWG